MTKMKIEQEELLYCMDYAGIRYLYKHGGISKFSTLAKEACKLYARDMGLPYTGILQKAFNQAVLKVTPSERKKHYKYIIQHRQFLIEIKLSSCLKEDNKEDKSLYYRLISNNSLYTKG